MLPVWCSVAHAFASTNGHRPQVTCVDLMVGGPGRRLPLGAGTGVTAGRVETPLLWTERSQRLRGSLVAEQSRERERQMRDVWASLSSASPDLSPGACETITECTSVRVSHKSDTRGRRGRTAVIPSQG